MKSEVLLRSPLQSEKEGFNNWDQSLKDKTGSCFTALSQGCSELFTVSLQ